MGFGHRKALGCRVAALLITILCLASAPALAVACEVNAPGVNGFTSVDKVSWRDSKGLLRELYFAREYPNSIVPHIMGYVTRLTWQPDATSPRIIAEENSGGINASDAQGWGITIMHLHWSGNNVISFRDTASPNPSAVASVTVTPSTATVAGGGAATFLAQARDAAGNVVPNQSFTWSAPAAAGTITSSGAFTASCATGTYTGAITARASNGVTGSATVVLVPGSPAELELGPGDTQLSPGATQQFAALVRDGCNHPLMTISRPDAGTGVDAGAPVDAGASVDGGAPVDA